jgi:hypothetical protein
MIETDKSALVFMLQRRLDLYVDTNVSEKYIVAIFMAGVG